MIVLRPNQDSRQSVEEVRTALMERLTEHVAEPTTWYKPPPEGRRYVGWVNEGGFQAMKVISRNAFKPVITGRFVEGREGLEVHLSMRIAHGSLVFLGIWFVIVGNMFYAMLRNGLEGTGSLAMVAVPVAMAAFVVALARYAFRQDGAEELTLLRGVIEGR
jgi:hypothetical protein